MSCAEAFLGRGDENLAGVLRKVWERGGRMENWGEYFNFSLWEESFRDEGIDMAEYLAGLKRETLPWHKIRIQ